MNKYLEKIASFEKQALNAQAAREMAKKVGVIADPESNWKYALRNLRDGRGNPLEGQPRREALTRLAGGRDIVREHQQMAAAQRKLRDVDEVQQVNVRGKEVLPMTGIFGSGHLSSSSRRGDPLARTNTHLVSDSVEPHIKTIYHDGISASHVHPTPITGFFLKKSLKEVEAERQWSRFMLKDPRGVVDDVTHRFGRSDTPHRLAGPSGSSTGQQAMRHMGKAERVVASGARTPSFNPDDSQDVFNYYLKDAKRVRNQTYQQRGTAFPAEDADQGAFSTIFANQVNPIHAPTVHAVGLHKTTTGGPLGDIPIGRRSVYLDMTPRKIRNAQ